MNSQTTNNEQPTEQNEWPLSLEWPRLGMPLRVTTGFLEVDAVLGGGFKVGSVTEVCGESGIGKTHLCMQTILAERLTLIQRGIPSMSMWITLRCDFPARRLYKICKKYYDEGDNTAMEDVQVLNADCPKQLSEVLTNVKGFLEYQLTTPKKTRVIVIDSLDALFSYSSRTVIELEEQTNMVTSIGFALKRIAEQFRVAILVCNRVVNSFDPTNHMNFMTSGRTVKPAVGKAWDKKLAARVILNWEMDQPGGVWQRYVYQAKGDAADFGKCKFEINAAGISVVVAASSGFH